MAFTLQWTLPDSDRYVKYDFAMRSMRREQFSGFIGVFTRIGAGPHIGVEDLRAACTDIIDQYVKYDLPLCWGSGESAAADGSLITTYTNNVDAQYHVRYQRVGGIAYRHVADDYILLSAQTESDFFRFCRYLNKSGQTLAFSGFCAVVRV